MRHILGEDLNVGCVLSWGPCWYYQKQFFEGKVHKLSQPGNLMRYDVEVSGFPSQHAGHLCLLRLKEDDYPGTTRIEEWPSWDLPILQWGKEQGASSAFRTAAGGCKCRPTTLPTYDMPKFDGIGANEYIVDVVHDVCDFISAVDTPVDLGAEHLVSHAQLRLHGADQRRDRLPLHLRRQGRPGPGLRQAAEGRAAGLRRLGPRHARRPQLLLRRPEPPVRLHGRRPGRRRERAQADGRACWPRPAASRWKSACEPRRCWPTSRSEDIRKTPLDQKPYWHVERARIGDTQQGAGRADRQRPGRREAGNRRRRQHRRPDVQLQARAIELGRRADLPECHTNPVFVEVDGKPIRASKKSAEWCLDAVDVCWKQKVKQTRAAEQPAAAEAYDVARKAYAKILAESAAD